MKIGYVYTYNFSIDLVACVVVVSKYWEKKGSTLNNLDGNLSFGTLRWKTQKLRLSRKKKVLSDSDSFLLGQKLLLFS